MMKISGARTYHDRQWIGIGGYATESPTAYPYADDTWVSSGTSTPQFHKRLRDGAMLPQNPYRSFRVTSFSTRGGGRIRRSPDLTAGWDSVGPHSVNDFTKSLLSEEELRSFVEPNVCGAVVTAAVDKLTRSGWDALTFLGELRESYKMLSSVSDRLRALLSGRGRLTLEDAWLEGRFGWRPLYSDLLQIQEALSKKTPHNVYTAKSGITRDHVADTTYSVDSGSGLHEYSRSLRVNVSYRGVAASMIAPMRVHLDILPTAWELVKLSFVVDWIFNVGAVLGAISGMIRTPDLQTSCGVKVTANLAVRQIGVTDHAPWVCQSPWYECDAIAVLLERSNVPPSYVPIFNPKFTLGHAADGLALLRQFLTRERR